MSVYMKLKKETITKTFKPDNILIETTKKYFYSTEETKLKHKRLMEAEGYEDSGQVKENIGTVIRPEYVWVGNYYKCEVIEL